MMLALRRALCLVTTLAVLCAAGGGIAVAQAMSEHPPDSANAKRLLADNCGACHGLDGKGSERAPNIADNPDVKRMPHAQVFGIIQNGLPGTGMPAFHHLSGAEIDALVTFLQMQEHASKITGDPAAGKRIFFGEAGCSRCHMVAGQGGFIASDLSDYSHGHHPEEIRKAIENPAALDKRGVKLVTVTLRNGQKVAGRLRNEDNFSIQLQAQDGTFHLLARSEVERMEANPELQMPSYSSKLKAGDIDDLISYLVEAAQASKAEKPEDPKRDPDDDQDN
jgi:putative heme-binding domain-containing protein